MAENVKTVQEQRKRMAEKLWLEYFNQTLYEKGYLTQAQRNRLKLIIDSRRPSAKENRGAP